MLTQPDLVLRHRGELEPAEYDEQRKETVDQLHELNATLKKVAANNMSLVDALGSMQLVWTGFGMIAYHDNRLNCWFAIAFDWVAVSVVRGFP